MKKYLIIFGIILFIVFFERLLSMTSFLDQLELITYDIRAKMATDKGPFNGQFKHAEPNIVIVAIDDYSRRELANNPQLNLGSWPWRRDIWADVLDFIEQGKPKAVLFDLVFNDLNQNAENDQKFSQALKKYNNTVLAVSLNDPKYFVNTLLPGEKIQTSNYLPTSRPLNVKIDDKNIDDAITFYSHSPIPDIYTRYNTMGVVNVVETIDPTLRRSRPIFKLIKNDKAYYLPSLAFAGFLKYMGEDENIFIKNNKIFYKNRIIPIDENGNVLTSWHGTGKNYVTVSIIDLLLSKNDNKYIMPNYFKDKIIIIGRTEAGTDIKPAAVNPYYAGPEFNATVLDNYINDSLLNTTGTRKFISKMSPFSTFILIVFACIFIGFMGVVSKNALVCFINSIVFIILYLIFSIWLFTNPNFRIWVPIIVPLYYFIMTALMVFAYKFQKELAKKAIIMSMFGKFVSPKVLTTLLKNQNNLQDNLVLKSTKKRITVMFCDIKNFTTLSEKCNPEQLLDNLNELFNEIVDVVFENNGTVDKFIGDCIMAYWGDPIAHEDDAFMAVKTALEIKQKVQELGIKNESEGKIVFDVKIGINTGEALLGLAGSKKIMSYTAMGDAVNVASRLESNCSKLGRDILISKSTYEDAKSKIKVIEVGKVKAKGRDEQIEVYEPVEVNSER